VLPLGEESELDAGVTLQSPVCVAVSQLFFAPAKEGAEGAAANCAAVKVMETAIARSAPEILTVTFHFLSQYTWSILIYRPNGGIVQSEFVWATASGQLNTANWSSDSIAR
jgi:hypothetical protein